MNVLPMTHCLILFMGSLEGQKVAVYVLTYVGEN